MTNVLRRMNTYHAFISYAAPEDESLAKALKALIAKLSTLTESGIYLASNSQLGKRWEPELTRALSEAKIVLALMTPNSVFRPWVIYESGGAAFHGAKHLFVVLAKGLTVDCLPDPLRFWHAGYLSDRDDVKALCTAIAKEVGNPDVNCDELRATIDEVVRFASHNSGDWSSVNLALVSETAYCSPFNLLNILTVGAPRAAMREVYLAGQNLYTPAAGKGFQKEIFDWLKFDKERRCVVLIVDANDAELVTACERVLGEEFPKHLTHSTAEFEKWEREAKTEGLRFFCKALDFLPLFSLVFVDPTQPGGFLVLTPISKPLSADRPHFVISRKQNRCVFNYYWVPLFEKLRRDGRWWND